MMSLKIVKIKINLMKSVRRANNFINKEIHSNGNQTIFIRKLEISI